MRKFWTSLVLLGVAVAVATLFAEGRRFIPYLFRGATVTLQLAVSSGLLCLVVAFVLGLARTSVHSGLRAIGGVLVELFRGSSLLVYLFWLYFVGPEFGIRLEPMTAGTIAIGLNYGAYGAEIVRGALQAMPRGQWEACQALNMTRSTALRRIIIPQALAVMVPPFSNLLIQLIKGTAMVSAITITELTAAAVQLNQMHLRTMTLFGMILVIYYLLSQTVRFSAVLAEQRLTRHLPRRPR